MVVMVKKKPHDRHRQKQHQIRMSDRLRTQLDKLAERNDSSFSDEVRIAIRERLERAGLWPPAE